MLREFSSKLEPWASALNFREKRNLDEFLGLTNEARSLFVPHLTKVG